MRPKLDFKNTFVYEATALINERLSTFGFFVLKIGDFLIETVCRKSLYDLSDYKINLPDKRPH